MTNLKILNVDHPLWSETLAKLAHDVYHLPEYVTIEAKRTKTLPEAFLFEDEGNVFFVPYLLRSCADIVDNDRPEISDIVSPYGYPGILVNTSGINTPGFIDLAWQKFYLTLKAKNVCSAFIRLHPILGERINDTFKNIKQEGNTVSIDLTLDENQIWAKTRKGHQSTINRCMRLGLTAKTVPYIEHIDEFITIYNETMDRVEAKNVYYFNREYFIDLLQLCPKVHLGIVEFEAEIICACLFFESCGIVQAHLGGTKNEFLKQSPFNLLLHHMRLWAKARGNRYLHLGGGVNSKKDNLYTFKSGFSRQRHKFFTLRSIVDADKYDYLVALKAQSSNKSILELNSSGFFPAYRTV